MRIGAVAGAVILAVTASACTSPSAPPAPSVAPFPTDATTPSVPSPSERLGIDTGWGPSREQLDRAATAVARLSLAELAGQVIVASWRGPGAPVAMVRRLHLGGVIAMGENIASPAQIRSVNQTLERRVPRRWPLFLGVDQEGGVVERVKGELTRFPAFMSAGAAGDAALTERVYAAATRELRSLGFTVDFAPDADVTSGPGDPTIGARSAGSDPEVVARQSVAAASGMWSSGVVPVVKHFPGHGSAPADSHLTLPVVGRSRARLSAVDLVPFREAVAAGLPAVMVGHLDVRAVDPGVPSSLSRRVVTGLLRGELGHRGLVVTDALDMGAVTRHRAPGRAAVAALRAGNDVLLMPPSPDVARAAIVRAVRDGHLSRRRLEQAAARQVALLRHLASGPVRPRPPGSARSASRALSAAALTSVAGPCRGRLVGAAVSPEGDPVAVANLARAAGAAGLEVLLRRRPPAALAVPEVRPQRRKGESRGAHRARVRRWERREDQRARRLESWTAAEEARLSAGTRIALTGYGDAWSGGDIAVATDTPYVLGTVGAPVRIAAYGDTPGAMSALVDVLLGRAQAPGRLPVPVPGLPRRGC